MDTEVVERTKKDKAETVQESSSKRAGDELKQELSKKQKIEDENESAELKRCLEIVPDDGDEVTINATPLSTKSPTISKNFDELMSTPIDFSAYIKNRLKITNLTQETLLRPAFRLLKGTCTNYVELEYNFEECYKALSEKLDWENPKGGDYPFDLTKPLPLVKIGNHQKSPVKVAYDKHALWGISHWRDQRKSFYGYARGLESTHDVYSTKRILIVTLVGLMRKHGYGYLKEIVNRLTNLSGDDIFGFAIALRMFIRSIVIQKRVEDLQLAVKSYQKKINVTKPKTTKPDIRKKDPYTPYQDPQGFIYVDTLGRNRLMRLDELYKFRDGTLTRLQTLLEDITKNIYMEYMQKRRWSTLEKKQANIMIKTIDKKLEERRMTRSLKKFVGGRHYKTDLWLL
nr:hypothetical protein [Tanacetum cinerariifolium]